MSTGHLITLYVFGIIATSMLLIAESDLSGRQVVGASIFWPIFLVIYILIGAFEVVREIFRG